MPMSSRVCTQSDDSGIRQEVLDPRRSFIVQAPAGSGKTELLMQRYLSVLQCVDEPESALAITFTRKAAAEMRNRILEALSSAATRSAAEILELAPHKRAAHDLATAVLKRDRELGWNLLQNPSRLAIRTVDSFCESIARSCPLTAALAPDLQVTENSADLYAEAARRCIAGLGGSGTRASAVAELLRQQDNNVEAACLLIAGMLGRRDQWLRFVGRADQLTEEERQAQREHFESSLKAAIELELHSIEKSVSAILSPAERTEMVGYANVAVEHCDKFVGAKGLTRWPAPSGDAISQWIALTDFMLTGEGTLRKSFTAACGMPAGVKEIAQVRKLCTEFFKYLAERDGIEDFCAALDRVRKLPSPRYSDEQWAFTSAMLSLLPHAVAELNAIFAERGTVDFIEVALAAARALGDEQNPTDLGLSRGARIRHILVDEFQDTSRSQMLLLRSLVATWEHEEDATVFLVGDPMQSIYAFRQADVLNYLHAQQRGLGPLRPEKRELRANFRSQQKLIEWYNSVFPRILDRSDEVSAAIEYAQADPTQPALDGEAVRAFCFPAGDYRAEAEHIAACIAEELRNADVASIAVLVRARTHLPAIIESLQSRAIAFRAVDIDPLSEVQAVRDLESIRRALMHPADRTSWLSILRAPWCGLTFADLWQLCGGDATSSIRELLDQRISDLSEDGQKRARRLMKVLSCAQQSRDRMPFSEWLHAIWVQLGGMASLAADDEVTLSAVQAYFDLLLKFESQGSVPEGPEFERQFGELYAPANTSPGTRVEVMTIHKAKGLEWDVVFLPGLGRKPNHIGRQLLHWRERELNGEENLLLAPVDPAGGKSKDSSLAKYLSLLEKESAREETKRLLYVAATRARKRLYLTTCTPKNENPEKDSMLAPLWNVPDLRETFEQLDAAGEPVAGETVWRRLPADWQLPPAPDPLHWVRAREAHIEESHSYEWVGDLLPRIGTVVHSLLQQIAREGVENWSKKRVLDSRDLIAAALFAEGVSAAELEGAIQRAMDALIRTLDDERGRWLLAYHESAACELALTGPVNAEVRSVKIDRTFVDEGIRWIVDYKTADREGAGVEQFIKLQAQKYREDLQRYASLMREFDPQNEIRCALYFPLLQRFEIVTIDSEE
jgi:ATP-dependent helicase/nuclease subunit A